MERLGHRTPIHAAQPVRLRELGYDERWLQDWLAADPTRLGLGQVVVLAQELTHATGGSLDILAADGDTYYSVEVQLGEVDASHGFRVLDYWAHNRARYPDKTHVAALLVESADGRFRQALQAIAEYLPLIVVALRAWRRASEVVLVPEPLIVNEPGRRRHGRPGQPQGPHRAGLAGATDRGGMGLLRGVRRLDPRASRRGPGGLQPQVLHRPAAGPPGVGAAVVPPRRRNRLPA